MWWNFRWISVFHRFHWWNVLLECIDRKCVPNCLIKHYMLNTESTDGKELNNLVLTTMKSFQTKLPRASGVVHRFPWQHRSSTWDMWIEIEAKTQGGSHQHTGHKLTHYGLVIWYHMYCLTLDKILVQCLMAPSLYLSQCWLIINSILGNTWSQCMFSISLSISIMKLYLRMIYFILW